MVQAAVRKVEAPTKSLPSELHRRFRLVAFDWDGTAVTSRQADATRVTALVDALLGAGARIAIITGTNYPNVARQLGRGIARDHARRLFVCTNRGSEVFGFDFRGAPCVLYRREATSAEDRMLDVIADGVRERLSRRTGLDFEVVRDRLNRRKIDLIPELVDPPKSAIGELLRATEARLRGAGLTGGLREAFELTVTLARETGLPDARVTSDVKHMEVGLTDKGDSMAWVMREVAVPLAIRTEEVLVAGDELGPIAGFEGSDLRMVEVAEAQGATVISVGPEPAGAPPPVIHLGGGPERFCDVLELVLAEGTRVSPFRSTLDAAWVIEEPGFDVAREHEIESLLAIANGYVGSRGSIAEGSSVSRPATFLAGAFEPSNDIARVPELVIVPDWGRLRVVIEGTTLSVEDGHMQSHRRLLDMRRGALLREGVATGPQGHVTHLATVHLASLADRHLLVEGVEVCPENYSGRVRVDAILSGDVRSESGAAHWASFAGSSDADGPTLVARTQGGLVVALASHLELAPGLLRDTRCERDTGPNWAAERCDMPVKLGTPSALFRTVAVYSTRDCVGETPSEAAAHHRAELRAEPLRELVAQHEAVWAERWRKADVAVDGAPALTRALRFAAYHLIAAAHPDDPRCGISARSLSGQAYRGHVFWDQEIFMLPFFVHSYPEAARALVMYRALTLPAARRKAAALGYQGALYPWESADTGDETTPAAIISPFGEILRVLNGEQEQHISADVGYAVSEYGRRTADEELMRRAGDEIVVETARFWASRVEKGDDGLFHIRRVIGPDEYHESVDDNAFTNWMARENLRRAARVMPNSEERRALLDVADRMYLGIDERRGIIEQFAGFFALEEIDLSTLGTRHAPADVILGHERTQRAQVVKQADVVMLLALLWDEISPEVRRNSFLYYEPRTAHGSSLSPGTHALVAARLGLTDVAERYLEQTATIDLGNTMGNAAGGVHAAALGSLWQAVVLGAGGLRPAPDDDRTLLIEPRLLPDWHALRFPFAWRKRQLDVVIEHGAVEVAVTEGPAPLRVRVIGPDGLAVEVRAAPGARYAARLTGEGFTPWEKIG